MGTFTKVLTNLFALSFMVVVLTSCNQDGFYEKPGVDQLSELDSDELADLEDSIDGPSDFASDDPDAGLAIDDADDSDNPDDGQVIDNGGTDDGGLVVDNGDDDGDDSNNPDDGQVVDNGDGDDDDGDSNNPDDGQVV
ncbi:MAG: hypothetical protein HOE90_00005, partial [Bacteriovoracaceae bacterium]|nr:hypothetical protein [Bacteriovoracaceae bacterium]